MTKQSERPGSVSVIIPTRNRADLLTLALDSVVGGQGVDVIVVDDGSTDGTCGIVRARYGARVRCVDQPPIGRSAARNRGVRETDGDYVLFLDSDDEMLPGGLDALAAALTADQTCDVVYGDGLYCDKEGRSLGPIAAGRPPVHQGSPLDLLVLHNVIGSPNLAMVRRSALDRLGDPWFDESLHGTEDADLWVRLAAAGCVFRAIPARVGRYRIHGGNDSRAAGPGSGHAAAFLRWKLKVMGSPYFGRLTLETRQELLRDTLVERLIDDPHQQEAVLGLPCFAALPARVRGELLFQLGAHTARRHDIARARQLLVRAWRADPLRLKVVTGALLAATGRPFVAALRARDRWRS